MSTVREKILEAEVESLKNTIQQLQAEKQQLLQALGKFNLDRVVVEKG